MTNVDIYIYMYIYTYMHMFFFSLSTYIYIYTYIIIRNRMFSRHDIHVQVRICAGMSMPPVVVKKGSVRKLQHLRVASCWLRAFFRV